MKKVRPTNVALSVIKYSNENLKLYSVMEFTDNAPSRVLRQIMSPKTLDIPFFDNLLSESDLMRRKRRTLGVAFSLTDIFRFRYNSVSGGIIKDVLQSHIPTGVTLLCPINFKDHEDPINLAFVMKRPTFDFLVDKHDKITLKRVLKALSSEFSPPSLPPFLKQTNNAFTSHISYNSDTSMFSLFVRLKDHMGLAPNVLRSRISTVVLVRNASQPKAEWKMSVRGRLYIGGSTLRMQYSQLSNDDHEKVYGLTGVSKFLRMQDIIKEFKPKFYANKASKQMIQNTEIDDFTIKKVNLFSRVTRTNTPHILLTGFTSLPAWEKQIRVAMLLLSFKDKWFLKMAVTFTHSPLSNILQALTGFDTRDISVLHNTHIMTSIITSTLRDHSFLPPKIITTPLLRLPIAKGITVIALLKFPDNCGDDKICQAAVSLLGKSKVYTLRGELSMDGFTLQSPHSDDIILGHGLEAVNNTLEFTIANDSRFDVTSSLIIKRAKLSFDGKFHIYKTGQIQVQMQCRKTLWTAPFGLHALAFKDMSLTTFFKPGEDLKRLKLEGTLLMGALGNGGELKSPLYLEYNPSNPHASSFHSNISNVTLQDFMKAFTIDTPLPYALKSASFPNGLMVSYSSIDQSESSDFEIHGDVLILGRSLACDIKVIHPGTLSLITDNSPAPVILGGGQIIVQKDAKSKLRGPHIFAKINHSGANVTMSGYVKVLGIESEANISITDDGLSFEVTGKIMDYKEVTLKAESKGSLEDFTVRERTLFSVSTRTALFFNPSGKITTSDFNHFLVFIRKVLCFYCAI